MALESDFDFSGIFPYCYRPGVSGTPTVGQSPSAVRLCNKMRKENIITATLLASNGICHMKIYASDEAFEEIYRSAKSLCKNDRYWREEPRSLSDVRNCAKITCTFLIRLYGDLSQMKLNDCSSK
jgi:hypothetical protein